MATSSLPPRTPAATMRAEPSGTIDRRQRLLERLRDGACIGVLPAIDEQIVVAGLEAQIGRLVELLVGGDGDAERERFAFAGQIGALAPAPAADTCAR